MNSRRMMWCVLGCALVWLGTREVTARTSAGGADAKATLAPVDAKILAEIRDHSEAMENLEYLSDEIGPRLTGSPQLQRANEWTRDMFKK
jgi:carboxypeptidase Q